MNFCHFFNLMDLQPVISSWKENFQIDSVEVRHNKVTSNLNVFVFEKHLAAVWLRVKCPVSLLLAAV